MIFGCQWSEVNSWPPFKLSVSLRPFFKISQLFVVLSCKVVLQQSDGVYPDCAR